MKENFVKFLVVFFVVVICVGGTSEIVSLVRFRKLGNELIKKSQDLLEDRMIISDENISYAERVEYLEAKVGEVSEETLNHEIEELKNIIESNQYKLKSLADSHDRIMNEYYTRMNEIQYMRMVVFNVIYKIVVALVVLFGATTIRLNQKKKSLVTYAMYFILLFGIHLVWGYISTFGEFNLQDIALETIERTALLMLSMFVLNVFYSMIEKRIKAKIISK